MSTEHPYPRVGVSALIFNSDRKILVGRRIGSHGAGTIQVPGGHLEYAENFLRCAERETLEETGLNVRAVKHVATTNDVFEREIKHYVTIFVLCELIDKKAEPRTLEPGKCEDWEWRDWVDLTEINSTASGEQGEKLFLPLANLLKQGISWLSGHL